MARFSLQLTYATLGNNGERVHRVHSTNNGRTETIAIVLRKLFLTTFLKQQTSFKNISIEVEIKIHHTQHDGVIKSNVYPFLFIQ